MRQWKQKITSLGVGIVLAMGLPMAAFAQSSSSPNYRVDQTFFGSGGELEASSTNFKAKQSAGELSIGNACSTSYCAWAGFNTTDDPYIEMVVTGNNIDLGYLDTATTKTANGEFAVRAWQADGYVVRTLADPPTNTGPGAHQLTPLASPTASATNNEQFGINLVDNTSPVAFGDNPLQSPDGTFSFGQATTDYATPNVFKYAKGDAIAQSTKSTSITVYTISYIFNIDNNTPSGQYNFSHVLVATGTY